MKDGGNRLKTLLLTLNESDLLSSDGIENLFSRFLFIRDSGVKTLIIHVDILSAAETADKDRLIHFLGEKVRSAFQAQGDSSMNCLILNGEDGGVDSELLLAGVFSVLFSLGPGGRAELKNILSAFIEDCKAEKTQPADMTQDYIFSHLALPFTPDLIVSSSKNKLSDFMIWQTVYSEYYFMDKEVSRWTDSDLKKAFGAFYSRDRRYGV
ncbi:MAG: undecaprenyl diphosphate synthase family protein [Methanimicrococcus sp.]|nr:undecaprenyl diphosphate synthase family protein [Methanimicrococcus sp.]